MAHPTATYTRRGVLVLGGAAVLSGALRRLLPYPVPDLPNDFPVASYQPPSGPVDVGAWRLTVGGAVSNALSLSYQDLLGLPRERHRFALACITGWSSTQDWEGIQLSALLALARPLDGEANVRVVSADGFSVTLEPSQYRQPEALIVTHVAGGPLSDDHGFPARLMLPYVVGVTNVKWLTAIELLAANSDGPKSGLS